MRTRNHFCVGEGIKGFLTVLSGHYPAGRVAVLCQDPLFGQQVAASLVASYKVSLFPYDEKTPKKEDVRFVIGVGSPAIVPFVISYAKEVPFAFFCDRVDYRYLNPFDGSDKLSEFAYLDKTAVGKKEIASCYSTLFCLWAESHIREMETSYLPFRDRTQEGLRAGCERVLGGECDKEEFLSESLRLTSAFCNLFREKKRLYVERTTILGMEPEEQFAAAYLSVVLLNTFTKNPVGGILNPTDETIFLSDDVPKENMKAYAKKMRALATFPQTDAKEIMELISAVAIPELPLLERVKAGLS